MSAARETAPVVIVGAGCIGAAIAYQLGRRWVRGVTVLEKEPFERLARDKQFAGYPFDGFWACMDTYKDNEILNDLWHKQQAPWKTWKK